MRLQGRLTGHFLGRVALMLAGLAMVFGVWLAGLAAAAWQANRQAVPPSNILRAASRTTVVTTGTVTVATETVRAVRRAGMWLQVLDEGGDEVAQVDRPSTMPRRFTPGGLVMAKQFPAKVGMRGIYTWVESVGGRELTFVLGRAGAPPQGPSILIAPNADSPSQTTLWLLMIGLMVGGAVVTLGVAWLFGRGLARPLVHMMDWLQRLARGEYEEPSGRDGRPASRTPDGRNRRRSFATYREVFDSLDTLSAGLRRNDEERARIEAAREEWVAGVSHDLRTPLSSVRGYADVLASDYDFSRDEVRAQAAVIAAKAEHMDALLDDLNLTFRLRADALPLQRTRTDLVELVREAAVDLANDPRAAERAIVFEEPPGSGELVAEVDQAWLRRAVANLLTNAAVHNPPGTTVRASVERDTKRAVITVADDGRGMDEATLARLFDRYYRGTATGEGADGTGLGMAIARQIVEASGGSVEVESSPGVGTTVRVVLPLAGATSS